MKLGSFRLAQVCQDTRFHLCASHELDSLVVKETMVADKPEMLFLTFARQDKLLVVILWFQSLLI